MSKSRGILRRSRRHLVPILAATGLTLWAAGISLAERAVGDGANPVRHDVR